VGGGKGVNPVPAGRCALFDRRVATCVTECVFEGGANATPTSFDSRNPTGRDLLATGTESCPNAREDRFAVRSPAVGEGWGVLRLPGSDHRDDTPSDHRDDTASDHR
jgi:hypothetical protein